MKKLLALVFAVLMLVSLFSCSPKNGTSEPARVYTLNGTTGFGMVSLMQKKDSYTITVESDPVAVREAVISGSADIATGGDIQVLAVNTLGVLYLVGTDEDPVQFSDFAVGGKYHGATIYCPEQNPQFLLRHLLVKAGLTIGEDVLLDTTYAQPAALMTAAAAGQVSLALLPEPMVSVALQKSAAAGSPLHILWNMSEAWESFYPGKGLVQGVVVARKDYIQNHPKAVEKFLSDYEASIRYVNSNPADLLSLLTENGLYTGASLTKETLERCHITFLSGNTMKTAMEATLQALFETAPKSIGNALPDAGFYYTE